MCIESQQQASSKQAALLSTLTIIQPLQLVITMVQIIFCDMSMHSWSYKMIHTCEDVSLA